MTGRGDRLNTAAVPAFEKMVRADVGVLSAIERQSSPTPWTVVQIEQELLKPMAHFWVARENAVAIGYGGFWLVAEEAQLANLAVHPSHRCQGVGRGLLRKLLKESRALGAGRMTLEVREGNNPARRLYESEGFGFTSRRPAYYEGHEAALLMTKTL